jgi:hypothetical protein
MSCREEEAKTVAPDDPTVRVWTPSVYPMPWSRGSVGLSDGRVKANRDDLVAGSSAPDDSMHHRCIESEQLC